MIRSTLARTLPAIAAFLGRDPRLEARDVTLLELMNLDDRQLEDIGLTRETARHLATEGRPGLDGVVHGAAA
ncbi:MAG: DUF1127 domain-containing protein [Azospirillaceae bacterium]